MKPLTVEQLRSLKVGDWLWIKIVGEYGYIDGEPQTGYYQLCHNGKASIGNSPEYITAVSLPPNGYNFEYPDYGTKWVAYKNKEQAECNGEIVELPCIRKVTADNMEKYLVYHIGRCGLYENAITYDWCDTYKQAECRLAELSKE